MPEAQAPTILAFDTAGPTLSVAAVAGGRPLAVLHRPLQRGHAELLLPTIDAVLRAGGLTPAALDVIATTTGPGSFTGLRTGLAAAQGLAFATRAKPIGIDRYAALASVLSFKQHGRPVVVALDSKTGSLYVQAFDESGQVAAGWPAEGRNVTAVEAAQLCRWREALLAGDGVPSFREAGGAGHDSGVRSVTAVALAAEAAKRYQGARLDAPLRPLYLASPRAIIPKEGGRVRARRAQE
jgi:tRNA threonylcarbamoyladenosine biosynthesis protein TsaB